MNASSLAEAFLPAGALETDLLLLLLRLCLARVQVAYHSPSYEFGDAELAPRGVGASTGGWLAMSLRMLSISFSSWVPVGRKRSETQVPRPPGASSLDGAGWKTSPESGQGCGLLQGAHSTGLPPSCRERLFGSCSRRVHDILQIFQA